MPKNSIVPICDVRCSTGGLRIGDDWPGLFIRGDDALGIQVGIGSVLNFIKETNRNQFEQGTIPSDVVAGLIKLSTLFNLIKKDVLVSAPDGWSKKGRNR